jgi:hypothetical protein
MRMLCESLLFSLVLLRSSCVARGVADGLHIHNAAADSQGKKILDALQKFVEWKWDGRAG